MNRLCESILPCLIDSRGTIHQIACPEHPRKLVTHFCNFPDCKKITLCKSCLKPHTKIHKTAIKPLNHLTSGEVQKTHEKKLAKEFSTEQIQLSKHQLVESVRQLKTDIMLLVDKIEKEIIDFFNEIEEKSSKIKKNYTDYRDKLAELTRQNPVQHPELVKLIDDYKNLSNNTKFLEKSPQITISNFQTEAKNLIEALNEHHLPKFSAVFNNRFNFNKLKQSDILNIPESSGVLYEASDYIPHHNYFAVAYRDQQVGSLAILDMNTKKVLSQLHEVHKKWINHLKWIPEHQVLVSCSNDHLIKVFRFAQQGKKIYCMHTFRGHTNLVRSIKYIPKYDVLISAGDDINLKLWDMKRLRLRGHISTGSLTNMDGTLAYIEIHRLVGIGFRAGVIKFFDILSKTCQFEIRTGYTNFYTYGLRYLPKKKLILGRVKENTIKVWAYNEQERQAKEYKKIDTIGHFPDCIMPNDDESQILMSSRDSFVEVYDFGTNKSTKIDLSSHLKKTNSLNFIKNLNKITVCDYASNLMCVLEM